MNRKHPSPSPWAGLVGLLALFVMQAAAAQAWSPLATTGGPPSARFRHSGVYAPGSNSMIVFDGDDLYVFFDDIWVLSHADGTGGASNWSQLTPASGPSPRSDHAAVYAPGSNSMIVFGGYDGAPENDVWVLSNADGSGVTPPAWTQLTPSGGPPTARYYHTGVYAPGSNSMIVFGGCVDDYCNPGALNDVWVLSNADGSGVTPSAWTQLTPAGGPSARYLHSAVYAAGSNSMIVFGGYDGSFRNDVWVLSHADGNGGTPAWTQLTPVGGPAVRYGHTAVYDPANNSMIVFGGYNGSYLNDVWMLSHADGTGGTPAWTKLSTSGGPPAARAVASASFSTASHSMTVFGGIGSSLFNDTWILSDFGGVANIDIRPNLAVNLISRSRGTDVPVAILSSASFNALTDVDRSSLTFGHAGTENTLIACNARGQDVNADGRQDLVCHFNGTLGGFQLGDTTGYLQGRSVLGNAINGSDSVLVQ